MAAIIHKHSDGYPADEVLGRNCRFLSGPATEPWLTEEIRRGVREHRPVLVEIINYKHNGQPFRNAVLVPPIYDEQDALLYFLGSQVEIDADASAPSSMRRIRAAEMVKALSPRQGQVLRLVANGLLNKQIAAKLRLAERPSRCTALADRRSLPHTRGGMPSAQGLAVQVRTDQPYDKHKRIRNRVRAFGIRFRLGAPARPSRLAAFSRAAGDHRRHIP